MKNNFIELTYIISIEPDTTARGDQRTDAGGLVYKYERKCVYVNKNEILCVEQIKEKTTPNEIDIIEITLKNGEKFQAEGIVFELLNILNED